MTLYLPFRWRIGLHLLYPEHCYWIRQMVRSQYGWGLRWFHGRMLLEIIRVARRRAA